MPSATVSAPARLHVGFVNLSLARDRVYGGIGMAVEEPRTTLTAEPGDGVTVTGGNGRVRRYVERAVDLLDVPGAAVEVESLIPPHVGMGSGTQLALTALAAVGDAHDVDVDVRERAPALGRGGRSGVGVATFEDGGFVVDAGHPARRFTVEPPAQGDWDVPAVVARHGLPDDWRAVVAVPTAAEPVHGSDEDARLRDAMLTADAGSAAEVDEALVDMVLPGAAEGDRRAFAAGVERIDRVNGAWYADVQGGRHREPARPLVEALRDRPDVDAVGQSSWGPAVYGVTTASAAEDVRGAVAGDGRDVVVTPFDDEGARRD